MFIRIYVVLMEEYFKERDLIEEDYKYGWKQHFPTYHFRYRDIALEEYKVASKSLESEERIFLNASNITLVSSAALGSLLIGSSENLLNVFTGIIPSIVVSLLLMTLVMCFAYVSLKYFSDRQRAITFAGRKVIILRRMLGLNYGEIQLLLPNWRVEGADQPLALRLFTGWLTYVAYPFWIVAIISCSVLFFLCTYTIKVNPTYLRPEYAAAVVVLTAVFCFCLLMIIFRRSLLDTHETLRLLFYKFVCKIVNLPIAENSEYIIYRAKLAAYETDRLKVNLDNLKTFLIFIEDRGFYRHSGICYRSLGRVLLGQLGIKRRSGGSTIIQQLVRTLFIRDLSKAKRRKFVELGMAPWLNDVLKKGEILRIYLSSVRFERGHFGVVEAMKYFWGEVTISPSKAQAFFLIERVSNINSRLLTNKIIDTARCAKMNNLLSDTDLCELGNIYKVAIASEKIISRSDELNRLLQNLR